METFGQKLSGALRDRGLRDEDVAEATGLDVEHIRALARDDFDALPGDTEVLRGLEAFARLMDVNPDQVIGDFRTERWRRSQRREPAAPAAKARQVVGIALPVGVILASALVVFLFWPRASSVSGSGIPSTVAQERTPPARPAKENPSAASFRAVPPPAASPAPAPIESPRPAPVEPQRSAPVEPPSSPPPPAAPRSIEASEASVPQSGVGRDIVGHDLVGETRRFGEGERVYFWTRIERAAGQTIEHVWIHDGREALRVPVRVRGAHWRAHSYKLLNAGSTGKWTVEARDAAGRVLARREFSCSGRGDGA